MPSISVIIPVYNAAPYLSVCINSLIGQTFTDWEAICINDGSTDDSERILQQFAAADVRIKVISKENGGVSVARNAGIEQAEGEYICMMDSDDEMPPDALENLWQPVADGHQPDMVFGAILWRGEDNKCSWVPNTLGNGADDEGVLTDRAYIAGHANGLPFGKLYRRDIFKDTGIRYDTSIRYSEDHHLILRFLMHCHRFYATRNIVYHYILRGSSAMGRFSGGTLPLQDYVRFFQSKAETVEAMPTQWPEQERRDYAEGLLFFFWRDWRRAVQAVARVGLWRVLQLTWALRKGLRYFSAVPGLHPVLFTFGKRQAAIFEQGVPPLPYPVTFPLVITKEICKWHVKKLILRVAGCFGITIARWQ